MKLFNKLYKYLLTKETLLYIIFGIGTTAVNILVFQSFIYIGYKYTISNVIAIIIAKLFAYITNKTIVFKTKTDSLAEFIKEFVRFFIARGFTGIIDFLGVIFLVDILGCKAIISKYFIQIIIIVLNYILSKSKVFIK